MEIQMKYQLYILGAPSGDGEVYRQFAVPVSLQDGKWSPTGPAVENSSDQFDIALEVEAFRDIGEHPCGPLEDIPASPPWRTVARCWLADDFTFPTPEELQAISDKSERYLRDMGIID